MADFGCRTCFTWPLLRPVTVRENPGLKSDIRYPTYAFLLIFSPIVFPVRDRLVAAVPARES